MLVCYRSADWCPYCKTQLVELRTRTADLAKNSVGFAAVSYDAVPLTCWLFKAPWHYIRAVVGSGTCNYQGAAFSHDGASNESAKLRHSVPGTFTLNAQGVVTSRFFERSSSARSRSTPCVASNPPRSVPLRRRLAGTSRGSSTTRRRARMGCRWRTPRGTRRRICGQAWQGPVSAWAATGCHGARLPQRRPTNRARRITIIARRDRTAVSAFLGPPTAARR